MKIPRACATSFILLITVGCSNFDMLNAITPSCGTRRTVGIAFGPLPRQKLDIYLPTEQKTHAGIVIFFYGGGWQYGERNDYRFVGEALASRGFVTVIPDYRLYPPNTFPSFLQDGALAVRWAHDNASWLGSDVHHLFLMGHSAGAHTAIMLTLDNEYLKAVGLDRSIIRATAGLSGPYDFVLGPRVRPVFGLRSDDPAAKPWIEPINFVDGHASPILLLHGLKDDVVEPGNSARLADHIRRAGGEVKFISYSNLAHVGVALAMAKPFQWLAPVVNDSVTFFEQH